MAPRLRCLKTANRANVMADHGWWTVYHFISLKVQTEPPCSK